MSNIKAAERRRGGGSCVFCSAPGEQLLIRNIEIQGPDIGIQVRIIDLALTGIFHVATMKIHIWLLLKPIYKNEKVVRLYGRYENQKYDQGSSRNLVGTDREGAD